MANNKIRIRLKSFDHKILDASAEKIISSAKKSGAQVGPRFEPITSERLIDIVNPTPETVDVLTRLELPSGVDIEIKL